MTKEEKKNQFNKRTKKTQKNEDQIRKKYYTINLD
jgi:hypothetical protein